MSTDKTITKLDLKSLLANLEDSMGGAAPEMLNDSASTDDPNVTIRRVKKTDNANDSVNDEDVIIRRVVGGEAISDSVIVRKVVNRGSVSDDVVIRRVVGGRSMSDGTLIRDTAPTPFQAVSDSFKERIGHQFRRFVQAFIYDNYELTPRQKSHFEKVLAEDCFNFIPSSDSFVFTFPVWRSSGDKFSISDYDVKVFEADAEGLADFVDCFESVVFESTFDATKKIVSHGKIVLKDITPKKSSAAAKTARRNNLKIARKFAWTAAAAKSRKISVQKRIALGMDRDKYSTADSVNLKSTSPLSDVAVKKVVGGQVVTKQVSTKPHGGLSPAQYKARIQNLKKARVKAHSPAAEAKRRKSMAVRSKKLGDSSNFDMEVAGDSLRETLMKRMLNDFTLTDSQVDLLQECIAKDAFNISEKNGKYILTIPVWKLNDMDITLDEYSIVEFEAIPDGAISNEDLVDAIVNELNLFEYIYDSE